MSQFVVNDPVYGFVSVPRGLLCELINHPAFQRLSRIRQLGMSALVYPDGESIAEPIFTTSLPLLPVTSAI